VHFVSQALEQPRNPSRLPSGFHHDAYALHAAEPHGHRVTSRAEFFLGQDLALLVGHADIRLGVAQVETDGSNDRRGGIL
jgi:hypothetical protein